MFRLILLVVLHLLALIGGVSAITSEQVQELVEKLGFFAACQALPCIQCDVEKETWKPSKEACNYERILTTYVLTTGVNIGFTAKNIKASYAAWFNSTQVLNETVIKSFNNHLSIDPFKSRLELYASVRKGCPPSSELHTLSRQFTRNIGSAETSLMNLMLGFANTTGSKEVVVSVRSAHNYQVLYSIAMVGIGGVVIGIGPVAGPLLIVAKVATVFNGAAGLASGAGAGLHLYQEDRLDGVLKIYDDEIKDVKKQIEDFQFNYCSVLQPIKDRCLPLDSVPQFCEDRLDGLKALAD